MELWETFLETLQTEFGYWNPLIWGLAIVICFLLIYIIRGFGKSDFKPTGEKGKVFLSGNPEGEKEALHIKGSNIYWGFTESLKWVYKLLDKMHTGNVSDYVLWFVIILGILFVIIGVMPK